MGRQHTVRQVSRQPKQYAAQQRTTSQPRPASNQNPADRRRKIFLLKFNPIFTARLIQRHPWLIWLVALSILVGSAAAAITTILDPDASILYSPGIAVVSPPPISPPAEANRLEKLPTPTPTPAFPVNSAHADADAATSLKPLRQRSNQPSDPSSTASPRSAVGAIVLSCAAGCFLLSQWLKPRPTRRRVLLESQPSSNKLKQIQHFSEQVQAGNPSAEDVMPVAAPTLPQLCAAPPVSFEPNSVLSEPPEALPAETVEVTVLPIEQSHPLDWDEPSLADSLDLRQRRPLSYWL